MLREIRQNGNDEDFGDFEDLATGFFQFKTFSTIQMFEMAQKEVRE